jgi:oxaloacetate decarboxylase alpha subunit
MKKIEINDITIRDIFQNMNTGYISEKFFSRIIEHLGKIKFDSLEVFGGFAFEKMLENIFQKSPFEIVSYIKSKIPNIPLQALIGARNLVGMEIYSEPVVKKFILECKKSGIDKIKVFDSLNDIENFKYTVSEVVENNIHCQGTIIYDDLKDIDYYVDFSDKLVKCGCRSICIKDAESTLIPMKATELFKSLSCNINVPFYLSVYNLRGLQISNYYNACIAGCNGVDISFIPSSYNDLSPAVFPFILSLKDTDLTIDLDYVKLLEVFEWFKQNIYPDIRNELLHSKFLFSNKNQNLLPKWLISSINSQLREIGEENKIDAVLEEVIKIKNEIGNPSLSVPVGQIIGTQAILNTIISDHRWEIINNEIKNLISGHYGNLPRKFDSELLKIISKESDRSLEGTEQYESSENKPKSLVEDKTFKQCASEISELSKENSHILSYLFFPDKTIRMLENKLVKIQEITDTRSITETDKSIIFTESSHARQKNTSFDNVDLKKIKEITNLVETSDVDEIKLEIDGVKISINKKKEKQQSIETTSHSKIEEEEVSIIEKDQEKNLIFIKSPIVGTFYRAPGPDKPPFVDVGSKVKKGDTLCIIEAMKMMNKINSEYDGEIIEILPQNEEIVEYDQTIMKIKNV